MNQELEKKTQEWMKLERKTMRQRANADAFYEKNLMRLIKEEYITRNKEKLYEEVDYLVVSVGTSYEPIVLNISLLQPKQILFLYSEKTKKYLNKIAKECRLQPEHFLMRQIHETNPLDIYREIKHAFLEWNKPEKLYIDFTGGTKAMSAAAAMAGAMIRVQLVYVGTEEYLTDFRKPKPGSEVLYFISNPLQIFGDLEIEKAVILFEEGNYAGVREKLKELKENVPEPDMRQQLNFLFLLACAYEQWDALDFEKAYDIFERLIYEVKRDSQIHSNFLLVDCMKKLCEQERVLKSLAEIPSLLKRKEQMTVLKEQESIIPLIFTMYGNALLREKQKKYDMATLLLYRVLEMIEQRRLSLYGLYVSDMHYSEIIYKRDRNRDYLSLEPEQRLEKLRVTVMQIKKQLFGKIGTEYLPDRISLLDGFILLLALNDEICFMKNGHHIDKLKRIRSMVYLRNNSIFAHGLGAVSYGDYVKFRQFVTQMLEEFCDIEDIDFKEYLEKVRFLSPSDSKNFSYYIKEKGKE